MFGSMDMTLHPQQFKFSAGAKINGRVGPKSRHQRGGKFTFCTAQ